MYYGMGVDFGVGTNPNKPYGTSIGIMGFSSLGDTHDYKASDFIYQGKKEDEFDPIFWDSQYERYMQVLDTDNEEYIALYTCMESANY